MSFLSDEEVAALGLGHVGKQVRISRLASLHNPANIRIGDHSRIDDFCVLSAGGGGIEIGRNVHIAVFCSLIGKGRISLGDFAGLSSRVAVYSSNDDYSGACLTGPTVPAAYSNITSAPVVLGRHVIIGSGSVVLPGVTVGEGAAIGALSLLRADCDAFGIYVGAPARKVRERARDLLDKEQAYLQDELASAASSP
ncbi:acyltransferase [Rugamonas aquatica]|uniref:Acyltransferase n=1 Tax=Rugamonas aquatica TaxID=2743357 RepID=A0A6A7MZ41_9BURK|nr:acyltransferase [Rugamonas aquatica]MQA38007.1 acyltransferase [Rugamonas aquatica]